jgi:enoyl-CoA hydratase/carnithine racemase
MSGIFYETFGAVARIGLKAPPVNALSIALLDDLLAALAQAGADDAVRAVVLASDVPRYFSAGLDLALLQDLSGASIRALLDRLYTGLLDAQFALGKPSIAAVAGAARGGGMTLAVSCNVIVAGEDASLGYPEIDVAMIPAIHLAHLPRIIGRHRAYELLFSGRPFDPTEAHELGLVSRLAKGSVLDEAMSLAQSLADKPPSALRAAHAAFMTENDHRASVQRAIDLFCANAQSEEGRKGVESFVKRRFQPNPP